MESVPRLGSLSQPLPYATSLCDILGVGSVWTWPLPTPRATGNLFPLRLPVLGCLRFYLVHSPLLGGHGGPWSGPAPPPSVGPSSLGQCVSVGSSVPELLSCFLWALPCVDVITLLCDDPRHGCVPALRDSTAPAVIISHRAPSLSPHQECQHF